LRAILEHDEISILSGFRKEGTDENAAGKWEYREAWENSFNNSGTDELLDECDFELLKLEPPPTLTSNGLGSSLRLARFYGLIIWTT